jgi:hypothetical protein
MLLKDEVGMLRQVPLFAGVAPAKLKLLAFTSDRVTYAPGQVIVRQGEVGDAAYVVRVLAERVRDTTAELTEERSKRATQ